MIRSYEACSILLALMGSGVALSSTGCAETFDAGMEPAGHEESDVQPQNEPELEQQVIGVDAGRIPGASAAPTAPSPVSPGELPPVGAAPPP